MRRTIMTAAVVAVALLTGSACSSSHSTPAASAKRSARPSVGPSAGATGQGTATQPGQTASASSAPTANPTTADLIKQIPGLNSNAGTATVSCLADAQGADFTTSSPAYFTSLAATCTQACQLVLGTIQNPPTTSCDSFPPGGVTDAQLGLVQVLVEYVSGSENGEQTDASDRLVGQQDFAQAAKDLASLAGD